MDELLYLYSKYKRGKREPPLISAVIESEGGQVLEHRQVSRLINSPFKSLRILPILYEFRVQYGSRRGHRYVRTAGDNESYEWAWLDGDGYRTLPVARDHACLVSDVRPVGLFVDSILVFGLIFLGVLFCIVVFLILF